MLENKVLLSGIILILATALTLSPLPTLTILIGVLVLALFYYFPLSGLITAILSTVLGEFGRVSISGISLLPLDLIAPAVLGVWLVRKLIRKEKITLDKVGGALIAFWAVALLSLLLNSSELTSIEIKTATLHLVRFVAISGFFFVARDLIKQQAKILGVLLLTGVILAGSGFYLLTILPDFAEAGLTEAGWDPHIGRLTSTWLDPNFIAGGFAFLLSLAGSWYLKIQKWQPRLMLSIIAAVLLVALLATLSRSGLLALAVAGLVLGLIRSRILLISLIVVALIGVGVSDRLQSRLDELMVSATSLVSGTSQTVLDPTAQLRVDSWREALRIWGKNPIFGTGYGTYAAYQTFSDEESHAATGSDSSLLNIGATTGVVGLGVFLLFLINLAHVAWSTRRDIVSLGLLTGGSGFLIHAVFVNSLFFPPLLLYLMIVSGLVKNTGKT